MADSRGKMRPHHNSRSPPFVLIGLLVVIAILAFNYWGASSSNNELLAESDELKVQLRQNMNKVDTQTKQISDRLEEIRKLGAELRTLKEDTGRRLDEGTRALREKDTMLQDKDKMLEERNSQFDSLKSQLAETESNRDGLVTELESCKTEVDDQRRKCDGEIGQAKMNLGNELNNQRLELLKVVQNLWGNKAIIVLRTAGVNTTGIDESQVENENVQELPNAKQEQQQQVQQQPEQQQQQQEGQQQEQQPREGQQQQQDEQQQQQQEAGQQEQQQQEEGQQQQQQQQQQEEGQQQQGQDAPMGVQPGQEGRAGQGEENKNIAPPRVDSQADAAGQAQPPQASDTTTGAEQQEGHDADAQPGVGQNQQLNPPPNSPVQENPDQVQANPDQVQENQDQVQANPDQGEDQIQVNPDQVQQDQVQANPDQVEEDPARFGENAGRGKDGDAEYNIEDREKQNGGFVQAGVNGVPFNQEDQREQQLSQDSENDYNHKPLGQAAKEEMDVDEEEDQVEAQGNNNNLRFEQRNPADDLRQEESRLDAPLVNMDDEQEEEKIDHPVNPPPKETEDFQIHVYPGRTKDPGTPDAVLGQSMIGKTDPGELEKSTLDDYPDQIRVQ